MAKKPETKFKEKVRERLEAIPDLWCEKIQQVSLRGTPDFLICFRGWFVAWELKVDSPIDALQTYKLSKVKKAGGIARVVTPQNLDARIEELLCLTYLDAVEMTDSNRPVQEDPLQLKSRKKRKNRL